MATQVTPKKKLPEAQNPLILRAHRLMEAFAKSDDERDFYLDRTEGFLIYTDLDKTEKELELLAEELESLPERYCPIPKLTFFETKKIMEGFVNEKVYDIDTKEKLLDIIQSKEGRENFLEFIYDHHHELEKWQQYYQERSRIRIIEWLRNHHFHFVFEEDLELTSNVIEKLKHVLFQKNVPKELEAARKALTVKAKTYYSNEALNPRPKRGRPPKQQEKVEIEPQITSDIYTNVPPVVLPFLFTPDIASLADVTFSSRFETNQERLDLKKHSSSSSSDFEDGINTIGQKIAQLRQLSNRWMEQEAKEQTAPPSLNLDGSHLELQEEDKELFQKLGEKKQKLKKENFIPSSKPKTVKKISLMQEKNQGKSSPQKIPAKKKVSQKPSSKIKGPGAEAKEKKPNQKISTRDQKVLQKNPKAQIPKKLVSSSMSKPIKPTRLVSLSTPQKNTKGTAKLKPLKKLLPKKKPVSSGAKNETKKK